MKHLGTKVLETERCILRRYRIEDAEQMYNSWATDPEVSRFLSWKPHQNIEETRAIICEWVKSYELLSTYHWVLELKAEKEIIGALMIIDHNDIHQSGEVGYCFSSKYWNKGYATEALRMVLKYLLEEVGFNRLEARYDTKNTASGKVMQKSGMHHEGILRQVKYRESTGFYDLSVFSILRNEI